MIALTAASLALAALQSGGTSVIIGHGGKSCGVWTEKRTEGGVGSLAVQSWLAGYLTGYNVHFPDATDDITAGVDFEGAVRWIDNYCAKQPLDQIHTAALQLISELKRRTAARR